MLVARKINIAHRLQRNVSGQWPYRSLFGEVDIEGTRF